MLLLRQLPAGSMSMAVPSISFLPERFPSYTSILLSLLASLVLLSFVRAAALCLRNNICKKTTIQGPQVQVEEKEIGGSEPARQRRLSWTWGLFSWQGLSSVSLSLPVTLTMVDKESMGKGVGMQQRREERPIERWQHQRIRRGGPAFETPLPALYQSEEPISMAKMIMSRHTYRKPANRPPARTTVPPTRKPSPPPSPPPPSSTSLPPPSLPPSNPASTMV